MKTLAELRQLEAEELGAIDTILAFAKNEGRKDEEDNPIPTAEEQTRIKSHLGRVKDYRAQIEQIEEARRLVQEQANARESQARSARSALGGDHGHDDGDRGPGRRADGKVPATPRDKDEEARHGFRHAGEQLTAIRQAAVSKHRVVDPRLRMGAATGMSGLSGADGAYLLAPAFADGIWSGVAADAPLNLIARCRQMTVSQRSVKLNADVQSSEADGSRHGGVRGYWMEEGGTLTGSQPKFRQMEVKPKKLAVLTYATEELLDDAAATESWLRSVVQDELQYVANRAVIRGTGAGQPLGIINSGGITTVDAESAQTSATPLLPANVDKMYARLNPDALMGAVWLINPGLRPSLDGMNQEVGTGGVPVYRPPGGVNEAPFGTLKGLPLIPCKWCSARNTTGDLILANLQGYLVATSGGVREDSSIHVAFTTDELAFRWIMRIDGQPLRETPVTHEFAVSGETFADFVLLATRS